MSRQMSRHPFAIGILLLAAALTAVPALAQNKVRIGKPQAGTFPFVPVDVGIGRASCRERVYSNV